MHSDCQRDLARIREDELFLSDGRRMSSGRLLPLSGEKEISDALCDLPRLSEYAEVELQGINGAPPTYILTESLISNPHIFIAFDLSGRPVLLDIKKGTEGHISIMAPTGKGKTVLASPIAAAFNKLGRAVFYCGLKTIDNTPMAMLKQAADSPTRLDKNGKRVPAPFAYFSLGQGVRTMGFNYLAELDPTLAKWLSTANTLMGLGFTQDDPVRQFFGASAFDRFEKTPWGTSWVEFKANLAKAKVDRDTRYSTAGACHMVSQQAAIEQANLPGGDPANIDIAKMINERGAVYCDFTYQEVGQVATANAALFVQSVILAKRRINPSKDQVILIVIDEAERYPLDALAQMCEQARSSGITLLLIYHGIEQMEDKWTSIAMTQVMFILGAVPGTKSEKFLQALFGTKIEYVFNFSAGSVTRVESTSETISPTGSSITAGSSISQNEGTCGFTARETFVWTPNDTLDLNNSRDRFVLRISPGAGFSQYGPRPIICQVANRARNFEEINRLADDILKNTPNTILPGESKPKQISAPALTTELSTKRHQFLDTLNRAAARIRESIA